MAHSICLTYDVRMQTLISIIVLLSSISFIVWWSIHDAPIVLSPTETPLSTDTEQTLKESGNVATDSPLTLDMSGKNLTKVPSSIFTQTKLQSLDLSDNALSGALQAEIRNLQNLVTLNLSNNQFTGVPAEIGQLKNLESLDLSNNQLTGLPYELGNLSNLKVLNLSGNNYSTADLEIIRAKLPTATSIITK